MCLILSFNIRVVGSYFTGDAGKAALESDAKEGATGGLERKSTRAWAMETGYDVSKLFNKVC